MQKRFEYKSIDEDIGKILHEIENYENFFNCYKSMMKKE